MMHERIFILSEAIIGLHLAEILSKNNPKLVTHVIDRLGKPEIKEICSRSNSKGDRLIAYCTDIIVPTDVLDALGGYAYNFHPAPPNYPGSHSASFAIYDGVEKFGVTAHKMEPKVDTGEIIGVRWFDVLPGINFLELEGLALQKLMELFLSLSPTLAFCDKIIPGINVEWSKHKTTKAMFASMQSIDNSMSEAEIRLRWRAFG